MKNLIVIIGIMVSFQVIAQEIKESSWKSSLRSVITSIAGKDWSSRLLGKAPEADVAEVTIPMPEIPVDYKKSTAVDSYTKQTKAPTEYDKLPVERKRQFDYNFVQELFQVTRKAQAKDEDMANWMNTLDQGGSREGIYQSLVLDEVYAAMENMDEKSSPKLVDFYVENSSKYLKQGLKAESLSSLNLYSLKRILTEKGLDLMDYYESKDLDQLYRWYANFSADLGKNQGNLLQTEVRSNPSVLYHYEWAKNMPIQHIKSEYIIKLHSAMNGLQASQM